MANDTNNRKNATNSDDKRHQNNGQGFAAMDDKEVRDIASQGGHAAQASGHAHKLTDEERQRGGEARADDPDVKSGELGRMGAEARWGDDSSSNKSDKSDRSDSK